MDQAAGRSAEKGQPAHYMRLYGIFRIRVYGIITLSIKCLVFMRGTFDLLDDVRKVFGVKILDQQDLDETGERMQIQRQPVIEKLILQLVHLLIGIHVQVDEPIVSDEFLDLLAIKVDICGRAAVDGLGQVQFGAQIFLVVKIELIVFGHFHEQIQISEQFAFFVTIQKIKDLLLSFLNVVQLFIDAHKHDRHRGHHGVHRDRSAHAHFTSLKRDQMGLSLDAMIDHCAQIAAAILEFCQRAIGTMSRFRTNQIEIFFAIRIASRSHSEIDNHNDCESLLCYRMFRYIRTLAGTLLRNSEYDGASNILS